MAAFLKIDNYPKKKKTKEKQWLFHCEIKQDNYFKK